MLEAGTGISLWAVGEHRVSSRLAVRVAPGAHWVRVRIEYPIDDDAAKPYEFTRVRIQAREGSCYTLSRAPGEYPPYEVEITEEED